MEITNFEKEEKVDDSFISIVVVPFLPRLLFLGVSTVSSLGYPFCQLLLLLRYIGASSVARRPRHAGVVVFVLLLGASSSWLNFDLPSNRTHAPPA